MDNIERRFLISPVTIENRAIEGAEQKKKVITGIAAKVNSETKIGSWFTEIILPGAFDDVLNDDVRCLFNHDPSFILARTASKTLKLSVNESGDLCYEYESPNRSYAKDLEDAIEVGDVTQSSFGFTIKEEKWIWGDSSKGEKDQRQIVKLEKLYDVSPVTFPAYQDTEVNARSLESYNEAKKNKPVTGDYELELKRKELELLGL